MGATGLMGAGALLIHGREVLFQQRAASEHDPLTWSVFGGMAIGAERPIDTMHREVSEEAGLDVRARSAEMVHRFVDTADPLGTFEFFNYAVVLPYRLQPILSEESVDARWFPLGWSIETLWDALPLLLHPGLRQLTEDLSTSMRIMAIIADHP